ncbi:Gfo/Idh/MocA family protein [Botrimarina hoheduenensis]|uniref:Putative 4,5-dihydroxyphthalate dehydrogenase n=1 Tax=Botrimarina hoheduenensis TaxID=2528000 RepID=A0A5C5WC26_9BACT|nr:Gfo/Idh/MocA family oxidoreductase [Botrimarina hoheduenensis]TWT47202.1 putative 4,5-dihydroxyphthalate dehydrogenase [Botrimarina hoheduenensis]
MPSENSIQVDRRRFLKRSVAAGSTLAALSASPLSYSAHSGVDETLRVGLVGCGGRGRGAAIDALTADKSTKLVAVGDAFLDRAKSGLAAIEFDDAIADRVLVDDDHIFDGFDAFKKVIDSGVDVVLLATPPHFRPQHLAYAVDAGKHVFVEKPISVDMPGAERIAAACQMASEKRLSIVSGLCWRYDLGVRETMRRIQDGAIGDIVAIESNYNSGTLWHRGDKPEWSRMEYQLRNWLYYTWLSGDIIAEQAIHSLDKTAWLLGDASPTKAMAMGGRQQRTDPKYGHVWDHFTVFYEYEAGPSVYFTCRQQDGCTTNVDETVHGTKGKAEVLAHRIRPNGKTEWRYEGEKPSMYLNEQVEFFASIRSGTPINDGQYMVNSTRIAHLGRMAAYSGQTLRWEDAIADERSLGPDVYAWTDVPEPPVAIPGVEVTA